VSVASPKNSHFDTPSLPIVHTTPLKRNTTLLVTHAQSYLIIRMAGVLERKKYKRSAWFGMHSDESPLASAALVDWLSSLHLKEIRWCDDQETGMGVQIFLGVKVVMYNGGWELLLRKHRDSSLASCSLRPAFNDQGEWACTGKKFWVLYGHTYRGVPTDQLKSNQMVMSANRLVFCEKKSDLTQTAMPTVSSQVSAAAQVPFHRRFRLRRRRFRPLPLCHRRLSRRGRWSGVGFTLRSINSNQSTLSRYKIGWNPLGLPACVGAKISRTGWLVVEVRSCLCTSKELLSLGGLVSWNRQRSRTTSALTRFVPVSPKKMPRLILRSRSGCSTRISTTGEL
jgi:hypothetical protein